MKILLINPATKRHMFSITPPLSLATLASYIPPKHDVEIIDETVSSLKFNDYDLVGISCMTVTAPRGYEIAQKFKEKGTKVIMGGIHPSMLPNEAINYCDSVVIGEAESIWRTVINDVENNSLKKFYYAERIPMINMPIPRRDLYSKRYLLQSIQTTRGCRFDCDFCSVSTFSGKTYRQRLIKDVVTEMHTLKSKHIFFADDNLLGIGKENENRAIKLCQEVKPFNKKLYAQVSINVGDNDKILKNFADAGIQGLLIGIESLNKENLKQMGKGTNLARVKNYKKIIKKIHNNGMIILGSFILGYDYDTKKTFEDIIDFIYDTDLDASLLSFLRPLPGTRLYHRLNKENRLLYKNYPGDWEKYNGVVFKPKNMTQEELEINACEMRKQITSLGFSFDRFLKSLSLTKSFRFSVSAFAYNLIRDRWEQ